MVTEHGEIRLVLVGKLPPGWTGYMDCWEKRVTSGLTKPSTLYNDRQDMWVSKNLLTGLKASTIEANTYLVL